MRLILPPAAAAEGAGGAGVGVLCECTHMIPKPAEIPTMHVPSGTVAASAAATPGARCLPVYATTQKWGGKLPSFERRFFQAAPTAALASASVDLPTAMRTSDAGDFLVAARGLGGVACAGEAFPTSLPAALSSAASLAAPRMAAISRFLLSMR